MNPPAFLTDPALIRLWDALPRARVVGGAVRDALLDPSPGTESPHADVDLATPDPPVAITAALTQAGIKVVPTGLAHGTVTAVVDGRGYEITTLRRDIETDGRHAVVAFTDDWKQDAERRDFTINAMSMTRDGTLHDDFGGRADLQAGRIRFVGDPSTRIAEDYLRILRLFRFYARFGRSLPDPVTVEALQAGIPGLSRLSIERVWNELARILATPDPQPAVELMDRLGIWAAVVPEAPAVSRMAGLPADPVLRLAAALPQRDTAADTALVLATRLKLSNGDRDRLVRLVTTPSVSGPDATLRRLLADHPAADLIDRTWLDNAPTERQRLGAMPRPVFPLEGRDVLALGVPSGPAVGDLLRDVRQWWMDGGCVADRAACLVKLASTTDPTNIRRNEVN